MSELTINRQCIQYGDAQHFCEARGVCLLPTIATHRIWCEFITALMAAYHYYHYLTNPPPFLSLRPYSLINIPRNTHPAFPRVETFNNTDREGIETTLARSLHPAKPGSFIGHALCEHQLSLYYIATVRYCYPYVDILVRDYTKASSINSGTFFIIRLDHDSNWIKSPRRLSWNWCQYMLQRFMSTYLPRYYSTPPLSSDSWGP